MGVDENRLSVTRSCIFVKTFVVGLTLFNCSKPLFGCVRKLIAPSMQASSKQLFPNFCFGAMLTFHFVAAAPSCQIYRSRHNIHQHYYASILQRLFTNCCFSFWRMRCNFSVLALLWHSTFSLAHLQVRIRRGPTHLNSAGDC